MNRDLNDNQLSGSIPNAIGSLSNLRRLWENLGHLSMWLLAYFVLARSLEGNQLSGCIPDSLGGLNRLLVLYVWSWKRKSLGSHHSLLSFMQDNQLSGPLPKSFFRLTSLSRLLVNSHILLLRAELTIYRFLSNNQLNGTLSDVIQLTNLTQL